MMTLAKAQGTLGNLLRDMVPIIDRKHISANNEHVVGFRFSNMPLLFIGGV